MEVMDNKVLEDMSLLSEALTSACFMVMAALLCCAFVMIRDIFRAAYGKFYCNKCGYYGKTSRHEGCNYIAAKVFNYDE